MPAIRAVRDGIYTIRSVDGGLNPVVSDKQDGTPVFAMGPGAGIEVENTRVG